MKPVSRWSVGVSFNQPCLWPLQILQESPPGPRKQNSMRPFSMPTASFQATTSKKIPKHRKSRTMAQLNPGLGKKP